MSLNNNAKDSSPINNEPLQVGVASLIADLVATRSAGVSLNGQDFLMLPPGFKLENVTKAIQDGLPAQQRKKGLAKLHSIDSFIQYTMDQARTEHGYIYADTKARTLTAVFNDFKKEPGPMAVADGSAGWRDHRAAFTAVLTPEAQRWIDHDGKGNAFGQTDFAEFIEDNLADIDPAQADMLLKVATTISVKSNISFANAKRLDNGQSQMIWNEIVDGAAGDNGELTIPKTFDLVLRLFEGDKGAYLITARLKYRVRSGAATFWYELVRPERSIEDAFEGYVQKVKDESGYSVLMGAAG